MAEEEKKGKKKIPTAQKRIIQAEKKQLRNKILKSKLRSAIRTLKEEKEATAKPGQLNAVYSLIDKCVKKGIYKLNKANRLKSQHASSVK